MEKGAGEGVGDAVTVALGEIERLTVAFALGDADSLGMGASNPINLL